MIDPPTVGAGVPSGRSIDPGRTVAIIGTHPPTRCGLATFTENVRACIDDPGLRWHADVVRVVDEDALPRLPGVAVNWNAQQPRYPDMVVEVLDRRDAVILQHEFGLFGGRDGESVLGLVDRVQAPLVSVLHTALTDPTPNQRRIVDALADRSDRLVVLTESARDRLVCVHRIPASQVSVIPHGATANVEGPASRRSPNPTVLTWGLLGPGKGIEHAIRATARLASAGLAVTYVVAGRTHPKVQEREGDQYLNGLRRLADELHVADHVVFDDGYRDWEALRSLIRSVDAVVLPYDSRDQVTSGVLVDALASAKPVISTRFPHAVEVLGAGAGLLVNHGDVDAMANAMALALFDPVVAERLARSSFRAARPCLWPTIGDSYRQLIRSVAGARSAA